MGAKDYEIMFCRDGNLYINRKEGNDFRSSDSKVFSDNDIAEINSFFNKNNQQPDSNDINLDKEINLVWNNTSDAISENAWKEFEDIARHFYKFGLKAAQETIKHQLQQL